MDFGHVDMRLGHGDGRSYVDAGGDCVAEDLGDDCAERIERDDPACVRPLRVWADPIGRRRIGEIGAVPGVERAGCYRQRAIDAIGAGVRADDIALSADQGRADNRTPLLRIGGAPADRGCRRRPVDRM